MNMIGHDNVRTTCPSVALARLAQFVYQNVSDGGARQDWLAAKRADRDEIDRKLNPYTIKALQVLTHLLMF